MPGALIVLGSLVIGFEAPAYFLNSWPTLTWFSDKYPVVSWSLITLATLVWLAVVLHLRGML